MAFVKRHTEDYLAALERGEWLSWKGPIPLANARDGVIAGAYFQWYRLSAGHGPARRKARRVSDLLRVEFDRRGLVLPKSFVAYEGGPCFCGKPGHYRLGLTFYCPSHYTRAKALLAISERRKRLELKSATIEAKKIQSDTRLLRHIKGVGTAKHGYRHA